MIAADLRALLGRTGVSPAELARRMGVDPRTARKWTRDGADPKYDPAIERALGSGFKGYSNARLVADINAMVAVLAERIEILENRLGDNGLTTYTQDDPPPGVQDDIYPLPDEPSAGWGTGPALK